MKTLVLFRKDTALHVCTLDHSEDYDTCEASNINDIGDKLVADDNSLIFVEWNEDYERPAVTDHKGDEAPMQWLTV